MSEFNFNRVLSPGDYAHFTEHQEVEALVRRHPHLFRYEHEHRKWEYGLALKFARTLKPRKVLEAGGGGSPLAVLLAREGYRVLVADLADSRETVERQNRELNLEIQCQVIDMGAAAGRFDLVCCTSVLEHVENDIEMVLRLAHKANRGLFLTVDFHPSGRPFSLSHLRTYNAERLYSVQLATSPMNSPRWGCWYVEPCVYEYTFAAMGFTR